MAPRDGGEGITTAIYSLRFSIYRVNDAERAFVEQSYRTGTLRKGFLLGAAPAVPRSCSGMKLGLLYNTTPYNTYAAIYDATGQSQTGEETTRALLAWLTAGGQAPREALDLGCGTGAAALALAAVGMGVTAVDRAAAMLAIAAGRVRDAGRAITLLEADLRESELPRASFDLITCFGVLNELDGDGDLTRLFRRTARWLRPGGHLAFDLMAPQFFDVRREADEMVHDGPDHMVAAQLLTDDAGQVWARRVLWFVREVDCWWRGEETLPLRAWTETQALDGLQRAGFVLVEQLSQGDGERVLFVARR
jgi:ubiquinone/menaquinone biosynthesis C-methylase UbiE